MLTHDQIHEFFSYFGPIREITVLGGEVLLLSPTELESYIECIRVAATQANQRAFKSTAYLKKGSQTMEPTISVQTNLSVDLQDFIPILQRVDKVQTSFEPGRAGLDKLKDALSELYEADIHVAVLATATRTFLETPTSVLHELYYQQLPAPTIAFSAELSSKARPGYFGDVETKFIELYRRLSFTQRFRTYPFASLARLHETESVPCRYRTTLSLHPDGRVTTGMFRTGDSPSAPADKNLPSWLQHQLRVIYRRAPRRCQDCAEFTLCYQPIVGSSGYRSFGNRACLGLKKLQHELHQKP